MKFTETHERESRSCGWWTLCFCLAAFSVARSVSGAPRPNIVVLLADDLGSHDVGWRGSEIRTPHLDRPAVRGATLEQFYVQPVCSPTRAALLTGRYPFRHGLQVGVVRPWAPNAIWFNEPTPRSAASPETSPAATVGKSPDQR